MLDLRNMDCMEMMKEFPDKHFDLAIVDPPYGVGQHFNFRYGVGEEVYENNKPNPEYWKELFRVSKNQIVWGGNYFTSNLPENRCWISWFKGNPLNSFSDFELAWTSFDKVSRAVKIESYGFNHSDKRFTGNSTIHPTQKPIQLYNWILENFVSEEKMHNWGGGILDTHLGSGSIAIACHYAGYDLTACEIDKEYYDAAMKRIKEQTIQTTIF